MNEAIVKALGEEKELHVMKGLFMSPMVATKGTGEQYYSFDLKVLKQFGDDEEYGQTYNLYNCIIPSDLAMRFTSEDIKGFKDCEVLVLVTAKCSVKRVNNNKFNNISFFVQHLELSRKVTMRGSAPSAQPQRVAL